MYVCMYTVYGTKHPTATTHPCMRILMDTVIKSQRQHLNKRIIYIYHIRIYVYICGGKLKPSKQKLQIFVISS